MASTSTTTQAAATDTVAAPHRAYVPFGVATNAIVTTCASDQDDVTMLHEAQATVPLLPVGVDTAKAGDTRSQSIRHDCCGTAKSNDIAGYANA